MKVRFIVEIDDPATEMTEDEWKEELIAGLDYIAGRVPMRRELSPISFSVERYKEMPTKRRGTRPHTKGGGPTRRKKSEEER